MTISACYYEFRGLTIPERMGAGLDAWIQRGELPGEFLQAVLCNDLQEALGRADGTNIKILHAYIGYLYNEAPSPCWGSPEKVKEWAAKFAPREEREPENSVESPEDGLLANLPHDA